MIYVNLKDDTLLSKIITEDDEIEKLEHKTEKQDYEKFMKSI